MSTKTLRLPADLKARIAAAPKRTGKTPRSLILEAIAERADEAERRSDVQELAEKRFAAMAAQRLPRKSKGKFQRRESRPFEGPLAPHQRGHWRGPRPAVGAAMQELSTPSKVSRILTLQRSRRSMTC